MLVITRKADQSFMIGDSIRVTILKTTEGGTTRIGIEAPREIRVLREELYQGNQFYTRGKSEQQA